MTTSGSYDFTDYQVLVVGGTRGEGHSIASAFAAAGAYVTVTGTMMLRSLYDADLSAFDYESVNLARQESIDNLVGSVSHIDVLVLAASCLYALVSFTVAERTRETAIRAALGARPASIVRGIARRAFVQLSLGVVIGSAASAFVLSLVASHDGGTFQADDWPLVVGALALLMVVVGMLACVRPTLRVLRIQPQEALKG